MRRIAFEEPAPPRRVDAAIPRELERICLRAMALRASDRYETAGNSPTRLERFAANAAAREVRHATAATEEAGGVAEAGDAGSWAARGSCPSSPGACAPRRGGRRLLPRPPARAPRPRRPARFVTVLEDAGRGGGVIPGRIDLRAVRLRQVVDGEGRPVARLAPRDRRRRGGDGRPGDAAAGPGPEGVPANLPRGDAGRGPRGSPTRYGAPAGRQAADRARSVRAVAARAQGRPRIGAVDGPEAVRRRSAPGPHHRPGRLLDGIQPVHAAARGPGRRGREAAPFNLFPTATRGRSWPPSARPTGRSLPRRR